MSPTAAERKYIQSAVQSASPIGLTILLYDRLVTDIRSAMLAIENRDAEKCCEQLTHAFLVLGHLASDLDLEKGGETAASLMRFYNCISAQLIDAQVQQSTQILQKQIELILEVRNAWQQLEQRQMPTTAEPSHVVPGQFAQSNSVLFQSLPDEPQVSSWTA